MSQRISLMWSMMPVFFWSWTKPSNSRPRLELERQAGRRQLLEHHRPVARVAGVLAVPPRRRRRQRQQVRVVVEQRRDDRHHLVRRGDPDMHMHTPDQHLAAPPLGALDQLGVARRVGQLLRRPLRERVRARAEQLHAAVVHDLPDRAQRDRSDRPSPAALFSQMPVTISTVLRSNSLCTCGFSPSSAITAAASLLRSRVSASTSANSHSTPTVGRCEPAKSMCPASPAAGDDTARDPLAGVAGGHGGLVRRRGAVDLLVALRRDVGEVVGLLVDDDRGLRAGQQVFRGERVGGRHQHRRSRPRAPAASSGRRWRGGRCGPAPGNARRRN